MYKLFEKKAHSCRCLSSKCQICSGSHNTLLHRYNTNLNYAPLNYSEHPSKSHTSVNNSPSDERLILATAVVRVRSNTGQMIPARALLDSGFQPDLITEELAQLLHLKKEGGRLNLNGIAEANKLSIPIHINVFCALSVQLSNFG